MKHPGKAPWFAALMAGIAVTGLALELEDFQALAAEARTKAIVAGIVLGVLASMALWWFARRERRATSGKEGSLPKGFWIGLVVLLVGRAIGRSLADVTPGWMKAGGMLGLCLALVSFAVWTMIEFIKWMRSREVTIALLSPPIPLPPAPAPPSHRSRGDRP